MKSTDKIVPRHGLGFGFLVLGLGIFFLRVAATGVIAAPSAPAAAASPAPDMALLEQESKFEKEKTEYLQTNILDKILGPGKAVVIVDVEMGLESRATEMGMNKKKSDKKKNEGEE